MRAGACYGRRMNDRRWIVDLVGTEAFEQLAGGLGGAELQSVLLEVMQRRARRREVKDVLGQYQRDRFCAPSDVGLRTLLAIDEQLLGAAAQFEALELSPVAPLGVCSTMALTDQGRVLSALRSTEVVSDPTNVLALECALRLKDEPRRAVHLVTSQRVLRTPPVPKLPGYSQHFRMFVLASAGLEAKDHGFTVQAVTHHIQTLLAGLSALEQEGYSFGSPRVEVLATAGRENVGESVVAALGAVARLGSLDHGYYSGGLRYQIWVTAPDGASIPLVDGGVFDWLARLTSNRRAVYVATGVGSQLIAVRFRAHAPEQRRSGVALV